MTLVGDPLEVATLISIGWTLSSLAAPGTKPASAQHVGGSTAWVVPPANAGHSKAVHILKRWPFSSDLKRMASLIGIAPVAALASAVPTYQEYRFVVKGAPEVITPLCKSTSVPSTYQSAYAALSCTGARILSLAYKKVSA
ncbi:MAG: hypothetical protein EOP02_36380, partial [Proteobacteria bacterium]